MENIKKLCVVSCPISTRSGYGARSRDFVRGLIESKSDWDIRILSQRWGMTWDYKKIRSAYSVGSAL